MKRPTEMLSFFDNSKVAITEIGFLMKNTLS